MDSNQAGRLTGHFWTIALRIKNRMVYPKSEKDNFLTNFRKGLVIASVMWDNTRNRNGTDIFDRKKVTAGPNGDMDEADPSFGGPR